MDGILTELLRKLPAAVRPFAENGFVVLAILAATAALLNPILELIDRLRRQFKKTPEEPRGGMPPPRPRQNVWRKPVSSTVPRPILPTRGRPIISVANLKGGVGKTTVTANFAAYLQRQQNKRVLLIDLDYQGSLSQTALAAAGITRLQSAVDDLIRGDKSAATILEASQSLGHALPDGRILTCYYEFSDTETEVMADWLSAFARGQTPPDIRFRLTELLREDAVQDNYDFILIDCPPRLTTGAINALCASTHLLIPTILDNTSAEAVAYFSRDIAGMREELFPKLSLLGVVPTMTWRDGEFSGREQDNIERLNAELPQYWQTLNPVLAEGQVPRKNAIGNIAGSGIGYVDAGSRKETQEVRTVFNRLGNILYNRLTTA